uniref:Uncharacterized protein n=1 Tax=Timema poppense TaxID=170557 RepID=A0A7R9H344_TIMPO|nr:unnamed protein product [Timema poppensis]
MSQVTFTNKLESNPSSSGKMKLSVLTIWKVWVSTHKAWRSGRTADIPVITRPNSNIPEADVREVMLTTILLGAGRDADLVRISISLLYPSHGSGCVVACMCVPFDGERSRSDLGPIASNDNNPCFCPWLSMTGTSRFESWVGVLSTQGEMEASASRLSFELTELEAAYRFNLSHIDSEIDVNYDNTLGENGDTADTEPSTSCAIYESKTVGSTKLNLRQIPDRNIVYASNEYVACQPNG